MVLWDRERFDQCPFLRCISVWEVEKTCPLFRGCPLFRKFTAGGSTVAVVPIIIPVSLLS